MKKRAIVASGHPLVSEAACHIMELGGNAFDAVVAAGFASSFCEPNLTSLGGGGFLLARTISGETTLFDFFVDTPGKGQKKRLEPHFFPITVKFPGSDQIFNIGLGSVAVPGTLRGYLHVHKRLGRLPLKTVLEPAINYCEKGVELNDHQAYFLTLLKPIMTYSQDGKDIYFVGKRFCKKGDKIFNKKLGAFLRELIKEGDRLFYEGEIAKRIVKDMEEGGGFLTLEDLKSYKVHERKPLSVNYKGHKILTNGYPSFGGPLLTVTFTILDKISFKNHRWGDGPYSRGLASLFRLIEDARPLLLNTDKDGKLSWAMENLSRIKRLFSKGTTHISICDSEGNVASMTTSNGEGSGYFAPGTGIMLNNMMGEDDLHPEGFHSSPPGVRVGSMMSPSLLLKDEKVRLVLGSGGSKRIRTAITQVVLNYMDFNMPIKDAVYAPRIHWDGQNFQIEPGYPDEGINALKTLGPVNLWDQIDVYFGGVHAVEPFKEGAGDPRRGGSVKECSP